MTNDSKTAGVSDPDISLYDALVAAEQDDRACCTTSARGRPRRRLSRFRHRLWICSCGQAWRTERGPYEKVTYLWRRWQA